MYYLLFIVLIMMFPTIAMEKENKIFGVCFNLFDKNPAIKDKAFKRLATKDHNNFKIFAQYFFEEARNANIAIPSECNAQLLEQTLQYMKEAIEQKSVKTPTNTLTARIYAFSRLTPEQQKIISPENYKNNREQADKIIWGIASNYVCHLYDLEMVSIKDIYSTAKALYENRIKELENY